jgi:hypothetical protein
MTLDTVEWETRARRAISLIFTFLPFRAIKDAKTQVPVTAMAAFCLIQRLRHLVSKYIRMGAVSRAEVATQFRVRWFPAVIDRQKRFDKAPARSNSLLDLDGPAL